MKSAERLRVRQGKDKNFWSVRANRDVRLIVLRPDDVGVFF
jgi:plasmid maintenance system killer protein